MYMCTIENPYNFIHILDFNDETLHSKEVLLAKDKHIAKDSDKVDGLQGSEFYLLLSI